MWINIITVLEAYLWISLPSLYKSVENVSIETLTTTWPDPETKDLGRNAVLKPEAGCLGSHIGLLLDPAYMKSWSTMELSLVQRNEMMVF